MGKWILQANDALQIGAPSEARGQLVFHTDLHNGLTEATQRGYVKGGIVQVRHRDVYVANVGAKNIGGIDEVTIDVIGATGVPPPLRAQKPHQANDEEWTIEAGMDTWDNVSGIPFYNSNGQKKTPPKSMRTVRQPKMLLVWKKWIRPPWSAISVAYPKVLPRNLAEATQMIKTYWAGGGNLESGAPRIGCVLGGDSFGKCYLCVDIGVAADGDFILRTAKFESQNMPYNTTLYPTP